MEQGRFKPDRNSNCAGAASDAFDRAFRRRSARLQVRPEQPHDFAFLQLLAARCSPLADLLPAAILAQQAVAQEASHRSQYPDAMRRIVTFEGKTAGRIVVQWDSERTSHGVDIAVLPELRRSGAGLCMLRSWLDAADLGNWRCTLQVRRDNPVARLYQCIGFRIVDEMPGDGELPFARMVRAPARFDIASRNGED